MKRIVALLIIMVVHVVLGVELKEMSITEGYELVKSYYSRLEFNKGSWGDDLLKLLPYRFLLSNGASRYVLSEAEYHHSDGMDWLSYAVINGMLKQLGIDVDGFWFWPYQLFLVEREDGRRDLIYYAYGKNVVVDDTKSERIVAADLKWRIISETHTGELAPKDLNKSIGDVLAERGVFAITQVQPYLYKGKDVAMVTNKSVVAEDGGLTLSAGRKLAVAKLYVEDIRRHRPDVSCDIVLMVVGDMDGDGVCDAYVSAEAKRSTNAECSWRLYSGRENRFADRDATVKIHSFEEAKIPARIMASRGDFYFVQRKTGERYVIVLKSKDGRIVPAGYLDDGNAVRKQRRKYGHDGVDFYTCLPSVGRRGIGDLDDLFKDYQAPLESIRRLSVEKIEVE